MKGVKGILLMAGQGERFDDPLPKQFHLLNGKKIYLWTLDTLIASHLFEEILLVTIQDRLEEVKKDTHHQFPVIVGGFSRQESSYRGLLACGNDTEIVVIHDAVRPFLSKRILEENVQAARAFGAVDTCIPSTDTLVCAPDKNTITSIPPRSQYLRGQTPQSFSYPLICQAHKQTKNKEATDDCQLVLEMGKEVHIVPGEETNFKITTKQDLLLASHMSARTTSLASTTFTS